MSKYHTKTDIYTLHRAFLYSFLIHGIPVLYHKNPAYDGIFLESRWAQDGDKRNAVDCL